MATLIRKLFRRRKQAPLVCAVDLDHDENHVHTSACFIDFEPLAVVELFQSQACGACAPAVPDILKAANHPNLQLLSYNVTLFNHLGHVDTYASSQNDKRQRTYVKKWARKSLFTPMVVVNGATDGPGIGQGQEVGDIVARARELASTMDFHIFVDANDTDVRIDSDKPESDEVFDIVVVIYDPREEKYKVPKGPNKGKKFPHKNVVQQVTKIGEWRGGNVVQPLPVARSAMEPNMEAIVMVQGQDGGPILGAARI